MDDQPIHSGKDIGFINDDLDQDELQVPSTLPLLAIRDVVVFPYMTVPLIVGRDASIKAVDEALAGDHMIFVAAQKDPAVDEPTTEDLYDVGTASLIVRMLKQQDGRVRLIIQGMTKARITEYITEDPLFRVRIDPLQEESPPEMTLEIEALMRNIKEKIERIVSLRNLPQEILSITNNIAVPGILADLVTSNLQLDVEQSQKILEMLDPVARLIKVDLLLTHEIELATVQDRIQNQAREKIDKSQREYFLREQMRAIQTELGDGDDKGAEIEELKGKILVAGMPEEAEKEALKQCRRLDGMAPEATEASMVRSYLDWMVEYPWSCSTSDNLEIKEAKKILDEDHYNLEIVKERILDYLSVRKLKEDMKGPILCLAGPPGVGKTSLGKSIARAMGRKFVRISLGGVRDEAEIRGHRRTYVGALPGRIIQGIRTAGSNNPVFMMDEIDKIGSDFRGDPSSALLEVLDPEQNDAFSDHYLNIPVDLSKVLFITTANLIDPIPSALKDRMEVIEIPGYTEREKVKIAQKFLIHRQVEENGITLDDLSISEDGIRQIIMGYTREAGLRNLERQIARICRKIARRIAEGRTGPFKVNKANLHKFLSTPRFVDEFEKEEDAVGVATGLAWTPFGGDVLTVEASVTAGNGKITLTGHMGDVMKESAQAAFSYSRAIVSEFGIDENFHAKRDIHIHVPAGAIPKDGPSAGITMATALISALSDIPVAKDIAMTGEITLRGRLLPIGGVKEKVLAAIRSKIPVVILPERNRRDLSEIPKDARRKIDIKFADDMTEVLRIALVKGAEGQGPTVV